MNEYVSICIPCYNGETYLREALVSAINQTYSSIEILLVDDGSTDGTLAIARQYAGAYPQVRLVRNTDSKGMVGNWERCIKEAKHDWIKFLFQDDVLAQDCVEKMLSLCRETNTDIGFCRRDFIIEDNAPAETVAFTKVIHKPEGMFSKGLVSATSIAQQVVKYGTENIIGEPTCLLFHKKLLKETGGFDARFKQSVDFEFALRAALTAGIAFTPEPLVKFRLHGGSQTTANTSAKDDAALTKRSIRSLWGDDILLLNTYLSDERFHLVRDLWTKEGLTNIIRYKYLRAWREYGSRTIREALNDVIPLVPAIKNLRLNYINYKREKWKYKAFLKQRKEA